MLIEQQQPAAVVAEHALRNAFTQHAFSEYALTKQLAFISEPELTSEPEFTVVLTLQLQFLRSEWFFLPVQFIGAERLVFRQHEYARQRAGHAHAGRRTRDARRSLQPIRGSIRPE